jgi:hypothetical protein
MAVGRRRIEHGGPWLLAFIALPAPLRELVRWVLRPKRQFLYGRVRAQAADVVLSGPFEGMRLTGHPAAPELLGTYELELSGLVRELAARPFHTIVNVGARYGFYAIGFARLMPRARVLAYEGDAEAHCILSAAIAANGVSDRVRAEGFADLPELRAALGEGSGVLLVCDIDGGEVELLDPAQAPALARATILVECHGPAETPTEPVMVLRFLPTHDVQRIAPAVRVLAHLPPGVAEPWRSRMPRTMEALLQEHRTMPQSWLLLTPRDS